MTKSTLIFLLTLSLQFIFGVRAMAALRCDVWVGFSGSEQDISLMADLGKNRAAPSASSIVSMPLAFEKAPATGILLAGYYTAAVSGRHNFYVNGGQLWVSRNDMPAGFDEESTASGSGATAEDFARRDSQRGKTMNLLAGQRYYLEIRAFVPKNSKSWVNLGLQGPDDMAPQPIPAEAFTPALPHDYAPLPATKREAVRIDWWDRAKALPGNPVSAPAGKNHFWYREPALHWTQALPLGNGRIGAMHFGGVADDRLQLNESTVWGGGPGNANNPAAIEALPRIRQLLFENRNKEAQELGLKALQGTSPIGSYQTLGELYLDAPNISSYSDYRRSLDLSTGLSTVEFTSGGVHHRREYFISKPANALVAEWSADQPGQVSLNAKLFRLASARSFPDPANPCAILMEGRAGRENARLAFSARLEAVADGGTVTNSDGILRVSGANRVRLLLTVGTNFKNAGDNPAALAATDMERVRATPYSDLRVTHMTDFQSFFNRAQLDFGSNSTWETRPTNERIQHFRDMMVPKKGPDGKEANEAIRYPLSDDDPSLFALLFQYGRYLLISSSRPGTMPANLQGIWAWKLNNIWNSDFHANVNVQMNYWPSCVTGLSEMQLPLIELMERLVEPGKTSARSMYGADGWVLHHLTDAWGRTAPADRMTGLWPMGAIWLGFHAWEQFAYTQDKNLLRNRSYPLMKGAAEFALDYLVEAPAGTPVAGQLVSCPSYSPENAFKLPNGESAVYTYGATMDHMLIRELLDYCIQASEILGTDAEFRARCQATIRKMVPTRISPRDGRIMEWIEDYEDLEPRHRHVSHLVGLFPGSEINPHRTPELAAAARKVLDARGYGGTGWSLAWKSAFYARLGDGDLSHCMLATLLGKNFCANGFDDIFGGNKVFQIDANFGFTAAVAEMLLQSHETVSPGNWIIDLLPALPPAWPNGSFTGLRARGGYSVEIAWKNGRMTSARITSPRDGRVTVRLGKRTAVFNTTKEGTLHLDPELKFVR